MVCGWFGPQGVPFIHTTAASLQSVPSPVARADLLPKALGGGTGSCL